MLKKAMAALSVLRKGQRLKKVEGWKNVQGVSSFVAAVVVAIGAFTGADVSAVDGQMVDTIATGLSGLVISVGLLFNSWTTYATSDKVGTGKLQVQPKADHTRGPDT